MIHTRWARAPCPPQPKWLCTTILILAAANKDKREYGQQVASPSVVKIILCLMTCVIDRSCFSKSSPLSQLSPCYDRKIGLHVHDQCDATKIIPHIQVNTQELQRTKKIDVSDISAYFRGPKIDAPGGISKPKSMHRGLSANQNRCTQGHRQTKIDAPNRIWCIDFLDFWDFLAPGTLIFWMH